MKELKLIKIFKDKINYHYGFAFDDVVDIEIKETHKKQWFFNFQPSVSIIFKTYDDFQFTHEIEVYYKDALNIFHSEKKYIIGKFIREYDKFKEEK